VALWWPLFDEPLGGDCFGGDAELIPLFAKILYYVYSGKMSDESLSARMVFTQSSAPTA
jgi:hypothetical protein